MLLYTHLVWSLDLIGFFSNDGGACTERFCHLAATVDAEGNLLVYRDGSVRWAYHASEEGGAAPLREMERTFNTLGKSPYGHDDFLNGYISDVRIYDYALSAAQADAFSETTPDDGLWHHWALAETSGTIAADTGASDTPVDATLSGTRTGLDHSNAPRSGRNMIVFGVFGFL